MKGSTRYKIIVYLLVTVVFFIAGLHGYFSFASKFDVAGNPELGYLLLLNAVVAVCVVASLFGISKIKAGPQTPKIIMQLLSYAVLLVSFLLWTAVVCFHMFLAHQVDGGAFVNFFATQMVFSVFEAATMIVLLKSISIPSKLGRK